MVCISKLKNIEVVNDAKHTSIFAIFIIYRGCSTRQEFYRFSMSILYTLHIIIIVLCFCTFNNRREWLSLFKKYFENTVLCNTARTFVILIRSEIRLKFYQFCYLFSILQLTFRYLFYSYNMTEIR